MLVEHPQSYPVEVLERPHLRALVELLRDPIQNLVGQLFGSGTAPALEELDQAIANVLVFFAGQLAVGIEPGEQGVEGALGKIGHYLQSPCRTNPAQ
jgi:hypothetical protein